MSDNFKIGGKTYALGDRTHTLHRNEDEGSASYSIEFSYLMNQNGTPRNINVHMDVLLEGGGLKYNLKLSLPEDAVQLEFKEKLLVIYYGLDVFLRILSWNRITLVQGESNIKHLPFLAEQPQIEFDIENILNYLKKFQLKVVLDLEKLVINIDCYKSSDSPPNLILRLDNLKLTLQVLTERLESIIQQFGKEAEPGKILKFPFSEA